MAGTEGAEFGCGALISDASSVCHDDRKIGENDGSSAKSDSYRHRGGQENRCEEAQRAQAHADEVGALPMGTIVTRAAAQ